jgi:hypothetical protein
MDPSAPLQTSMIRTVTGNSNSMVPLTRSAAIPLPKMAIPGAEERSLGREPRPMCSVPTRGFLQAFFVLLSLLLAYNFLLGWAAKSSQRHRLLASLETLPRETECLLLGNSLMEAGCDAGSLQVGWPGSKPVNIALGATSPVEHYLILKDALQQPIRPKYIVYGFFDDQLCDPPHGDWSELVGNRAISYTFPGDAAALYAPGSVLKKWQLWATGHIPMLAERSSPWSRVELLRRSLGDIGLPKHAVNRFGRVEDFAALEAKDTVSFNRRCEEALGRDGFSVPVQGIVRLAREKGVELILLEMPMPSRHRALFYSSATWERMRTRLEGLARQEGAIYLCASDWVPEDGKFEDATHLSNAGAREFSLRLGKALDQLESPRRKSLGVLPLASGAELKIRDKAKE